MQSRYAIWRITLCLILMLGLGGLMNRPVLADESLSLTASEAIDAALAYLQTQQTEAGGMNGFGSGADAGSTARTLLALAAVGRPADTLRHPTSDKTLLDYLETEAVAYAHEGAYTDSAHLFPAQAGLLIAALAAANEDPTAFAGQDLVAQLNEIYDAGSGTYSTTAAEGWDSGSASTLNQSWAILGLAAAGQTVPVTATTWLLNQQGIDGSWADGDPDVSALAVVALLGSGNVLPTDAGIVQALAFFRDTQLASGGWRPSWDSDPANADTTGWVVQALLSAGHNPPAWGTTTPQSALLALQQASGCIGGTYANAYSTIEALFGLGDLPLTFLGQDSRVWRTLTWLNGIQQADGSWPGSFGSATKSTCYSVLVYAAAGYDPHTVTAVGSSVSAMDYLSATATTGSSQSADVAGLLALAVVAAGDDPRDFGGVNLVDKIESYHRAAGFYGSASSTTVWIHSWAMLGMAATGETVPADAVQWLRDAQADNGSWGYSSSTSDDSDHVGLAMQALIAAGVPVTDTQIVSATLWAQDSQAADGGWAAWKASVANANSTGLMVQGLLAAGADPSAAEWLKEGHGLYESTARFQKADGAFVWMLSSPTDNLLATQQAAPALVETCWPIAPASLRPWQRYPGLLEADRTVAAEPWLSWNTSGSLQVAVPLGSDANNNGSVVLEYQETGAGSWNNVSLSELDGRYIGTVSGLEGGVSYTLRATYTDADGVQSGDSIEAASAELTVQVVPLYRYRLPFVGRQ